MIEYVAKESELSGLKQLQVFEELKKFYKGDKTEATDFLRDEQERDRFAKDSKAQEKVMEVFRDFVK